MDVEPSNDPNVGSAQEESPNGISAAQVISTLWPVAAGAGACLVLFLLFRKWFARNYRPRTFLGSLRANERSPALRDTFFTWVGDFYAIPDTYVLKHHTLDGYFFLRFLKVSVVCCLVGCLITWPVLFPVNITGGGGAAALDKLNFGNVDDNNYRYFAHAGCAIIFFTFVIYMITRESIFYINLRQAYLMSPFYASRISSRTVMYTSVPDEFMNEAKLKNMLGPGIKRIWFAQDVDDLEEKVDERDDAAMKLEGAETQLIIAANGERMKTEKSGQGEELMLEQGHGGNIAARYIEAKDRPTHKLKFLIGKKVDTIDWCRSELQKLIPEVKRLQAEHKAGNCKKLNTVFIEFNKLVEAQAAYQSLTHHQCLHMAPRYTGITPSEVIWGNLNIKWWERVLRQIVTIAAVVALVIFWSIPVAFVGAISNLTYLADPQDGLIPQLSFIFELPDVLLGLVTGLLPTIMLAVLMSLLPIFLRLMAKIGGDPTKSAVELTVQNFYFGFQVVQVFLVATIGSAASASASDIAQSPLKILDILAEQIPRASNFYLCYFILQGLGVVSGILLGLVGLLLFMVLGKLLDKTPRKMYERWTSLAGIGWGTLFPIYTNLFVIAICYAAIAPLVLGFAAIGLYLFYLAYRYNLLFVSNADIDTKGRIYPRALQQLFVGLYIAELCLIGLMAIATGQDSRALGPLILMVLMLVFTALYHVSFNAALEPLVKYLPRSLDAEERHLLAEEDDPGYANGTYPTYPDGTPTTDADGHHMSKESTDLSPSSTTKPRPTPSKRPNFFIKWLRPDLHCDYAAMRALVPRDVPIHYDAETEKNAYFHPAVASPAPLLWVPRDPVGISRTECRDTRAKGVEITDEGAELDSANKVVWDADHGRPPIWVEKVYY